MMPKSLMYLDQGLEKEANEGGNIEGHLSDKGNLLEKMASLKDDDFFSYSSYYEGKDVKTVGLPPKHYAVQSKEVINIVKDYADHVEEWAEGNIDKRVFFVIGNNQVKRLLAVGFDI